MSAQAAAPRKFRVHTRHAAHHSRIIEEPSFEAAAIAYAEDLMSGDAETSDMKIIVRDVDSGHEHCFSIDLETDDTSACC